MLVTLHKVCLTCCSGPSDHVRPGNSGSERSCVQSQQQSLDFFSVPWEKNEKGHHVARIPQELLPAFVRGEDVRGATNFSRCRKDSYELKPGSKQRLLQRVTYHCGKGPQCYSKPLAAPGEDDCGVRHGYAAQGGDLGGELPAKAVVAAEACSSSNQSVQHADGEGPAGQQRSKERSKVRQPVQRAIGKGPSGQRRSKVQHGESCKVGCTARFEVRCFIDMPGLVEITYLQPCHVNGSGDVCHGPEFSGTQPHLTMPHRHPEETRRLVQQQLQIGVPASTVQRRVVASAKATVLATSFTPEQLAEGPDPQLLFEEALRSGAALPKEYTFSKQDTRNERRVVSGLDLERLLNDAAAFKIWAAKHPESVLYCQDQVLASSGTELRPLVNF